MKVVRSPAELRDALRPAGSNTLTVGLVPTMGALHEGHLSLIRRAEAECDVVAVSIFVNPLQFGPAEDLASYPRDESGDLAAADATGADVVFVPSVEDMYPEGATTTISAGPVGEILEGVHRPGHFDGVCTVVGKLFNLFAPHNAYFGRKDAQQVAVLKRMVADLDFPVEIVVCPIVREPDGLALSSRNAYLSSEERARAIALYRALAAGADEATAGGEPDSVENSMLRVLDSQEGVTPDYAAVVDPDTFGPPRGRDLLLLVAARVGSTRLIDNLLVGSPERA